MGAIIAAIVTLIVYGIMAAFGAMLELSISLIAVIVVGALIVVSFVFTLGVSIFGPITVHSSPPRLNIADDPTCVYVPILR